MPAASAQRQRHVRLLRHGNERHRPALCVRRRGAAEKASSLGLALAVLLAELLDAALSVHQLLLPGEEWVAAGAHFDVEVATRRASIDHVATGTGDRRGTVARMDVVLHGPLLDALL